MPHMVRFERTNDAAPIFVNPALVRTVHIDGGTGETRIKFDDGHAVTVNGTPEQIVRALDDANRT